MAHDLECNGCSRLGKWVMEVDTGPIVQPHPNLVNNICIYWLVSINNNLMGFRLLGFLPEPELTGPYIQSEHRS